MAIQILPSNIGPFSDTSAAIMHREYHGPIESLLEVVGPEDPSQLMSPEEHIEYLKRR